ncbi:restriction endonuclease subunit S [Confluentibacter citreus]|uniref:restriction endonuclease subunit S n=1 Tax=Confluentibacter citreus TaxID=2007307 RepID=UPI000C28D1D9|nr:restriction endonuclease subunit S [Confluentibacter citreus]
MQQYNNYKNSGVEWLGEIPEHWEEKKFKHIFSEKKKTTDVDLPCGSISFGKVVYKDDEKIPESTKRSYQVLSDGDFLINPLNLNYDLISLRIALSDKEVVVSSGYIILDNNLKLNKNYYKWLLHIFDVVYMKTLGSGVRQTLSFTHIANCELVFPPLEEQNKIADFLETKTTKIDQAIAIKQKQIELLKESRQILIHKAVTRGLNDKVKLKDSGVEWIGEIPEHWKVTPLRHIGKTQNGISKGGEYFGTGFPFVSYGDVYRDIKLPLLVNGLVKSSIEDRNQYSVLEGDILFTRTSETVEEIGFSSTCLQTIENATFAGFLIRFRTQKNILHKEFSKYYFSSSTHRAFFIKEMNLVIRASLSQDLLKRMPVLLPPINEQEEIGNFLNDKTTKIATAISLKEQEIEKLKEYKMSLIDGVVTGKVRVC